MQTKQISKKKIFALFSIITMFFFMVSSGVQVSATTNLDITVDDWGIHVIPTFTNATYTIDGTGTDWWDSASVGMGSSISEPQNQQSLSGLPLTFSIGTEGYTVRQADGNPLFFGVNSIVQSGGSGSALQVTNSTSTDALTGFEEYTYETGSYDFKDIEDEDTVVCDTNVTAAANAFNVTSGYAILNETLSTAEEDEDFDNQDLDLGMFNRDEAYTYAVGYEDMQEGLGEDLKGVLALLNGVSIEKVRIQEYNLSTCYVSYNTTEALVTKMKGWIDEALEESASYPVSAGMGAGIQESFRGGTFNTAVSQNLRTSSISFGTGLRQFGERSLDWIRGIGGGFVNTATKAASDLWRTGKATLKSAISGGQKLATDISSKIGTGVNSIISKGMSVVKSAVGKVLQIFSSPLLWIIIGVVIIAAIVFGPRIVKAAQGTL